MIKNKENAEKYSWGNNCSGWHLVKSNDLSIIEEIMPPGTQEKRHYHLHAQQFFQILKGKAIFEMEDKLFEVEEGSGIHILPKVKHRIRNSEPVDLHFLVISQPTSRGDRFDEPC